MAPHLLPKLHFSCPQGTWLCPVCFEEKPGTKCVRMEGCHHIFCDICVTTHAGLHIAEGALDRLRCLDPTCKERLSRQVLLTLYIMLGYANCDICMRWEGALDQLRCLEP